MVQIVTNSADLQAYAAEQVLVKLREGSAHESMLKISGAFQCVAAAVFAQS